MKKRKHNIKIFTYVITAMFILLVASLFMLDRIIETETEKYAYSSLESESAYNLSAVKECILDDINMLKTISKHTTVHENNSQEMQLLLTSMLENRAFKTMEVSDLSGNTYNQKGENYNVSEFDFFKDALETGTGISKPLISQDNGKIEVVISIPTTKNGVVNGTIQGRYDTEKLTSYLRTSEFKSSGNFRIVDGGGNIILSTIPSDDTRKVANIFNDEFNMKSSKNKLIDDVKYDLANGNRGSCCFNTQNALSYAFYEPVGYSDWFIFSEIPSEKMFAMTKPLTNKIKWTIFYIFFVIAIIIASVAHNGRLQNARMAKINKRFQRVIKNMQGGVFENSTKEGFPIRYVSEGIYKVSGYKPYELINKNINDCIYKDDVEAGNKAVEDAMKTEDKEYEVEYRFIKKDGTLVWFLERGKILIDEKKKPIIQSVFIDIDDRKRLEQEIKIKDRSYEIAVQASDLIMFEYDVKMKKSKYYNIDIEEKSGKSIEELRETLGILSEDKKKIIDCYKKISEGVPVVEETIKRVNTEGAEEIYQLKLVAMYDEFKKPVRAVGIVKDITAKYI
ncbi:MAG: PAS domain-containing protein [Oscillospiraceae bacterium]